MASSIFLLIFIVLPTFISYRKSNQIVNKLQVYVPDGLSGIPLFVSLDQIHLNEDQVTEISGCLIMANNSNADQVPKPPKLPACENWILMRTWDIEMDDHNVTEESALVKNAGYSALIFEDLQRNWTTDNYELDGFMELSDDDIYTSIIPNSVGIVLRKYFIDLKKLNCEIRLTSYHKYRTDWTKLGIWYGLGFSILAFLKIYSGQQGNLFSHYIRLENAAQKLFELLQRFAVKVIFSHRIDEILLRRWGTGIEDRETCTICLENFKDEDMVRHLSCSHVFHRPCLNEWLMSRRITESWICPTCKVEIQMPLGNRPYDWTYCTLFYIALCLFLNFFTFISLLQSVDFV